MRDEHAEALHRLEQAGAGEKAVAAQREPVAVRVAVHLDEPGCTQLREVVVRGRLRELRRLRELGERRIALCEAEEHAHTPRIAERATESDDAVLELLGRGHGVADDSRALVLAEEEPRARRAMRDENDVRKVRFRDVVVARRGVRDQVQRR